MQARIRMKNPAMILADAMKGIQHLYEAMSLGGVPETTLELVHLRASQINGCGACVDAGERGCAQRPQAGETDARLPRVAAWRETDCFTDAERAAPGSRRSRTPPCRPVRRRHRRDLGQRRRPLRRESPGRHHILMIATTNLVNCLNPTIEEPAGAT